MAQLKSTTVQGALSVAGAATTTSLQTNKLLIPTASGGSTYGVGTDNYVIKSNGTTVYWGTAGTVTRVQVGATAPVVSSTSTAQSSTLSTTISLANGYGDTKNPYGTKTANYVLAGPTSGSAAAPSFRALVAADMPSSVVQLNKDNLESKKLVLTSSLSTNNSAWPGIALQIDGDTLNTDENNDGTTVLVEGKLSANLAQLSISQKIKGSANYETYRLPETNTTIVTTNLIYEILTSKNVVTISQGGTGASNAAGALTNLGALPLAGGTMTGTITLAATGLSTSGAGGYTTNSVGNFIHKRANTSDNFGILSADSSGGVIVYYDTGNVRMRGGDSDPSLHFHYNANTYLGYLTFYSNSNTTRQARLAQWAIGTSYAEVYQWPEVDSTITQNIYYDMVTSKGLVNIHGLIGLYGGFKCGYWNGTTTMTEAVPQGIARGYIQQNSTDNTNLGWYGHAILEHYGQADSNAHFQRITQSGTGRFWTRTRSTSSWATTDAWNEPYLCKDGSNYMTSNLKIVKNYPSITLRATDVEDPSILIQGSVSDTSTRLGFFNKIQGATAWEGYYLPATTTALTTVATYDILTTKNYKIRAGRVTVSTIAANALTSASVTFSSSIGTATYSVALMPIISGQGSINVVRYAANTLSQTGFTISIYSTSAYSNVTFTYIAVANV